MFLIYGKKAERYEYKVFEGYTEQSLLKSNIDRLISSVVEPVDTIEMRLRAHISHAESSLTSVVENEPENIVPSKVHSAIAGMEFNTVSFETASPAASAQGNNNKEPIVAVSPLEPNNVAASLNQPIMPYRKSEDTLDLSRLSGGAWAALTGADGLVAEAGVPMANSPVEPPFDPNKLLPESASGNDNNEPTIAVNPLKPNNLVAGYHNYDGVRYRVIWSYSFDGGQTWTYGGAAPVTTVGDSQADPVLAADELGNFYYCYMSIRSDSSTADIVVAKSADGGRTFPTYSIVYSGVAWSLMPDKCWIETDTWPYSPYKGRIYVTYTRFTYTGGAFQDGRIWLHYSTNRGATWSSGILVASSLVVDGEVQGSQASAAPDGRVYVALLDRGTWPTRGDERVTVVRSSNGGVSIDLGPVVAVPLHTNTNRGGLYPSVFRGESFPFIDVGPEGNIYVVYAHDPGSSTPGADDDGDIGFTRSTDRGVSWTNNWKVNDDATIRDQWWPAIKVEEDDGTIHLVWLDRRLDAADTYYNTYYAYSTDGGVTFPGSDVRVSTVSSNPGSDTFMGDYIDVDASAYRVHPIWTDRRTTNEDIYVSRGWKKPLGVAVISSTLVDNSVLKILDELGFVYDYYYVGLSADPARFPDNYDRYNVIIQAMSGGTVLEIPRIASFVDNGGRAILLGGSAWSPFVNDVNTYLMSVNTAFYSWTIVLGTPDITIVDPAHALAKDLPTTYNFVSSSATYYMLRITDTLPHVVAMNGDGYRTIVTKRMGYGKFTWFINSPDQSFWADPGDYGYLKTFLRNALKPADIAVITTSGVDNSILKALDELGYTYDYYYVSGTDQVTDFPSDYSVYKIIIQAMNGGTVLEIPRLADYVNNGGRAILLGGSALSGFVSDVNTYLMSVDTTNYYWTTVIGTPHITVMNPAHPLAKDLPLTYNFVVSGATYYMLRITDTLPYVVAKNGDGYKAIVTKPMGYGRFTYFINNPDQAFWTNAADYGYLKTFLRNALSLKPPEIAVISSTAVDNSVLKALDELGYYYDYYSVSSDPADFPADYSVYKVIVQSMDGGTVLEIPRLADFVDNGGRAILLGGSAWSPFVNDVNTYLMSVDTTNYYWTTVVGSPDITIVDSAYPLAKDLPATYNFVDSRATYYMLRITDPQPHVVALNGDGYKAIVTKRLGYGRFTWFINSPNQGYWVNAGDYGYLKTFLRNALRPAEIAVITTTSVANSVLKILDELGYYYDYYSVWSDPADFPADYSVYKIIIQAMDGGTVLEIQRLADFVNNGGRAILLGGSNWAPFVQDVNTYLMNVNTTYHSWTTVVGTPDIKIVDSAHPLARDLPGIYNFFTSYATYYMLRITDPQPHVVALNGDGYKAIVTKRLGTGRFTWFINSPNQGYWVNAGDYGYLKTFLQNALKPADIAVIASTAVNDSVLKILDELGYYYDYYRVWSAADFPSDYSIYRIIVQAMNGGTVLQIPQLAQFIQGGGRAILLGGSAVSGFVSDVNTYLMSVDTVNYGWNLVVGSPDITIVDPAHVLAKDLPATYNFVNNVATAYMLRITDPQPHVVAMNGDGYKAIVTKRLGNGRLTYFINNPDQSFWTNAADYSYLKTFLRNALKPPVIAVIATAGVDNSVLKILDELGYTYDYYPGWSAADYPSDYSIYNVIIQAMNGGTALQIPKLADYINNGGRAVLLGGSGLASFANDVNTYLMSVDTTKYGWATVIGTPDITIVDPLHPLAKDLPATYDFVNNFATYYMLRITDATPKVVATNGDGYKAIVTKTMGYGKFTWFINNPEQSFWTNPGDYSYLKTFLRNALMRATGFCYDYTISERINPPPTGDWIIDHVIECNDTEITLNGNLLIYGELRLNNVLLMMNVTNMEDPGKIYRIEVDPAGAFYVNSKDDPPSIITNGLNATARYTFKVNSGAAFEMRNSELHNCGYAWNPPPTDNLDLAGLWIATDNVIIENSLIDHNYAGMIFYNSGNHRILNNVISSSDSFGIYGLNSNNNMITGNTIKYNGWNPFALEGGGILLLNAWNTVVSNNKVYQNQRGHGIALSNAQYSGVASNEVYQNSWNGIYLLNAQKSNVTYNLANSNGWNGIVLSGSPNCFVSANTAKSNIWDGMVMSSSADTYIIGNTADGNGDDGIFLENSPGSKIVNNTPDGNGDIGIYVYGSPNTEITGNTADYNNHGIYVSLSKNTKITKNTANFNDNTNRYSTGIYVISSDDSRISDNTVKSNWQGIVLGTSTNTRIENNIVSSNMLFGIYLYSSPSNLLSYNKVDGSTKEWDSAGIYLSESGNNEILNNQANDNNYGIILWKSNDVHIMNNNANSNGAGISLSSSHWAVVFNNTASSCGTGISLSSSNNNNITENLAEQNYYGIYLSSSSYNHIFNNTAKFNYFGISVTWFSSYNNVTDNEAKSCYDYGAYLYRADNSIVNLNDFSDSGSVGIYLERSGNNNITNNNAMFAVNYGINLFESDGNILDMNDVRFKADVGIELSSSDHNNLTNNIAELSNIGISIRFSIDNRLQWNDVTGNDIGIYLLRSSENKILNNDASNNNNVGIDLSMSDSNTIVGNIVDGNPNYGIHLYSSRMNYMEGNSVNLNGIGIYLDWSESNTIGGNNVTHNEFAGIAVYWSSNYNRIISNQVHSNMNISIRISSSSFNRVEANNASFSGVGIFLDWSKNNMIINNLADSNAYHGIVLEWLSNNNTVTNNSVKGGLVGVSLDMSSNNTLSYNTATFNKIGILLEWSSNNNTIIYNTMAYNAYHGLSFHWESNYNLVRNNTIGHNYEYGVYVYESSSNKIYHNDMIYNIIQAFDNSINAWDNGYPTGGNFWSDYTGVDFYSGPNQNIPGSDGIGDTPYDIDSDSRDKYPLMSGMSILTHDVAIINVALSKNIVGQGFSIFIDVTIENQGDFTETFNVMAYANTTMIDSAEVTLTAGSSKVITFTWDTTSFAMGNYIIRAYVTPVPVNMYTGDTLANGVVMVTIPGDINGDKTVDDLDLYYLSKAFLSTGGPPPSSNWDITCDINSDNYVDDLDLYWLSINFLKSIP